MRSARIATLAVREVRASLARNSISGLGIAIGIGVLLVVVGLGLGARKIVLQEIVRELPVDMIEVVPKQVDLGFIKVGAGSLLGSTELDERSLEALERLPAVQKIYPKLDVKLPLGARGGERLFGRNIYTDLFIEGLPAELLEPEVGEGLSDEQGFIPVVISDQLIEIFNRSVAPGLGIPAMTGQTLKGFPFQMRVGQSLMLGKRGATKVAVIDARIQGVSRYAMRLGATIPLETAKRLVDEYGTAEGGYSYKSVIVRARSAADVPAVAEAIEELGLDIDDTAKRTADVMTTITLLGSTIGFLVLLLAALNIAHSFFASLSERRRELAIFRAVGARRIDLVAFVLVQAGIVGLTGGLLGIVGAYGAKMGLDRAATTLLPDFPYKPETFFYIPWWVSVASLAAAVGAGMLGALWPAVSTARAPVSDALSE